MAIPIDISYVEDEKEDSMKVYEYANDIPDRNEVEQLIDQNLPNEYRKDYLKIKARLRFYDTIDNRGCDIVVNLGAEAVTLPRAQVYNSSYSYLDVEIFLKKVSNSSEGILWQAHYGVGAPYITFNTVSTPIITGALLDFTNDIIITVVATYVDTTTPPGSNIAFTSGTNARIEDIIITKYLQ